MLFEGQSLTGPEIEAQLSYIENWCKQRTTSGSAVGALTTTDRTKWALNRQYLKSLDPKNEEFLNIIENSLMVAVLDDNEPLTQEEVIYFSFYYFESNVKNKNKLLQYLVN
jgi:carnitine O-acetyltransferase